MVYYYIITLFVSLVVFLFIQLYLYIITITKDSTHCILLFSIYLVLLTVIFFYNTFNILQFLVNTIKVHTRYYTRKV